MDVSLTPAADRALFFQFTKVDAVKREVAGVFTAERPDKDGEILDYAKSKPLFQAWSADFAKATADPANPGRLSLGNVRVMHTNAAAGKLTALDFDDQQKTISGIAKIVDDDAWAKCASGVYTGFSIGGKYVGGRPLPGQKYVAKPTEISIVDNPCLPDATFAYVKQDGSQELRKFVKVAADTSMGQKQDAIRAAIQEKYSGNPFATFPLNGWWIRDYFDDYVIVECGGKLYRIPYTFDDDQDTVTELGDPVEVHVAYVPETAEKAMRLILADVAKDHESFQVTQGGTRTIGGPGNASLAGPGDGRMVDVTGEAYQGDHAPRAWDEADEAAVQSLSIGVAKDADACPCADCQLERALASQFPLAFAEIQKADQTYATHGGEKVPRGKHAYAPAGSSPSEWKYPIDKPSRVRNAVARWGQHKGIPADEEPGVARRILAAAKRMGITVSPDAPIRAAATRAAKRESATTAAATVATVADEVFSMDLTPEALTKMVTDAVATEVAKRDDVFKGQKKQLLETMKAMKGTTDAFHGEMGKHFDKVLKAVEHGDDPANKPTDVDPAAALTAAGNKRTDQIADGPDQTWKGAIDELKQTVVDLVKALPETIAAASAAAVAKALGTDGAASASLGDRSQVKKREQISDADRAKLLGKDPADVAKSNVVDLAEVKKQLDTGDARSAVLNVMKTVVAEPVPDVAMGSPLVQKAFAGRG